MGSYPKPGIMPGHLAFKVESCPFHWTASQLGGINSRWATSPTTGDSPNLGEFAPNMGGTSQLRESLQAGQQSQAGQTTPTCSNGPLA
jgi:hypothetical protein